MVDLNRTIEVQGHLLRCVRQDLEELRDAFSLTGNQSLANDLEDMAVTVHNAQDKITEAYRKDIQEQVNRNMDQVGKTLSALVDKE